MGLLRPFTSNAVLGTVSRTLILLVRSLLSHLVVMFLLLLFLLFL